jgi:hypothetical protein
MSTELIQIYDNYGLSSQEAAMKRHLLYFLFGLGALIVVGGLTIIPSAYGGSGNTTSDLYQDPAVIATPTAGPQFSESAVLEYVAAREGIPIDQLEITYLSKGRYELIGREFWFVKVVDRVSHLSYGVIVDVADGSFVDSREDMDAAERAARFAQYGKLEPALYDRLQTMKTDDQIAVLINVSVKRRSDEELFAELATKYPEVKEAWEKWQNPFMVESEELGEALEDEYGRMIASDIESQIQPLVDFLQSRGYTVRTFPGIPALGVILPKGLVLEVAQREDVVIVFRNDYEVIPSLDTSVPSNRAPAVWRRSINGSGVEIAILEQYKIDFTGPAGHNYLHQGDTRVGCPADLSEHKTRVTSCAASYHEPNTGMAPQATVDDACHDGTADDIIEALSWATSHSDPINYSEVWDGTCTHFMTDSDWAFDYRVRTGLDTIVAGVGNSAGPLCSPSKAYNVISVGGSDNLESSGWTDDQMYADSNFDDPYSPSPPHDREEPEVVAPAVDIGTVGFDNGVDYVTGTSLATAQVTGLAALLVDRNSSLAQAPNSVKAITLASAVHNIEGDNRLSEYDGMGAIDAALADIAATTHGSENDTSVCNNPCWWNFYVNPTDFPDDTYIYRKFSAVQGERIRVAIAWWSNADCPDLQDCEFDNLDTDIDLYVFDPDNLEVGHSNSQDNNYEIMEFTAPKSGNYKIGVYRFSLVLPPDGETSNNIGVAWVRDATYLPDVRSGYNGWESEITIRNDESGDPRNVNINLFNADGTYKGTTFCALDPNEKCTYDPTYTNFLGSAVIDAGEDISVVVETQRNNNQERTNYTGVLPAGSSGSPGWEQTGQTLYAPAIKRAYYSRSSSIDIINVGSAQTTVSVYYYDSAGTARSGGSATVNQNAKVTFSPSGSGTGGCNADSTICSALISSSNTQPLAAVVREYNTADGLVVTTHNLFSSGATSIYFPLVKYAYYNMSTGLRIQNVGSQVSDIGVEFHNQSGVYLCTKTAYAVPPYAANTFTLDSGCPGSGFVGTAISIAGQPLVGMANEVSISGQNRKKAYSLEILSLIRFRREEWSSHFHQRVWKVQP